MSPTPPPTDCLVIGGGPAGLTAAIYLRRFHREVQLCDAGDGRALRIPLTKNFPGFPDGISGAHLLDRLRLQLSQVGGAVQQGTVEQLQRLDDGLFVAHVDGRKVRARTVILATGIVDVIPALPGAAELLQAGRLRFCPICDGFEFTGRHIGIIGSGAHGVREALFIRRFSHRVSYVCHGAKDASLLHPLDAAGVAVMDGAAGSLHAQTDETVSLVTREGVEHRFDVLYAALGSHTRSRLALAVGAQADPAGGLHVDAHARTSVQGLYAAGDVVCALDQLVVGMAHAATAATHIHNTLG
ncbi:NAD(P)/FAD-dependent oxidoreductase [Schlegelella sp. S2-27]|uniref:NAD(P)/FAD-dependent oxidoreductase n=1 Tax=Caldimonas mangrovi TaxID=2944811 RepID=A0ABT0YPD0_9BURK|nr:NAD(P)/FAD-dependent oxidoreductase [Caldimonas mangrovi]MCM5680592.1 NAD(P)/FAD-dependent oxidoreductase [Caldimonas mangrovi]